jgi:hypothetical protein
LSVERYGPIDYARIKQALADVRYFSTKVWCLLEVG